MTYFGVFQDHQKASMNDYELRMGALYGATGGALHHGRLPS
jgi:hypothetical protein